MDRYIDTADTAILLQQSGRHPFKMKIKKEKEKKYLEKIITGIVMSKIYSIDM